MVYKINGKVHKFNTRMIIKRTVDKMRKLLDIKPIKSAISSRAGIVHKVTAISRDALGNILSVQEGHNTVCQGDPASAGVENGFIFALVRLFDTDATYASWYTNTDFITTMELGTGTPGNSGLGTPYAAFSTQESIDYDITSIDKTTPAAPVITVSTTWGASYDAISGVTEVVLLNDSDLAFAYKSFTPALTKTTGGSIQIIWTVTLS